MRIIERTLKTLAALVHVAIAGRPVTRRPRDMRCIDGTRVWYSQISP